MRGSSDATAETDREAGPATVDLTRPPKVPRADVERLLRAYDGLLAIAPDPPPSVRISQRRPAGRLIARVLLKLRCTVACSTFLARHIRRRAQAMERAYLRRLATETADEDDANELALIRQFEQSLPPAPPRWVVLGLTITSLLLAQIALSIWESLDIVRPGGADLTRIATPDATALYDVGSVLVHSDGVQLAGLLLSVAIAIYLVLRLPVCGFRMARMLLNEPRALTWRNRRSELADYARSLDVAGEERALFACLREPAPRELPLDLLVKAAVVAAAWFAFVHAMSAGDSDAFGVIAATPLALRLLWLAVAGVRRGQWLMLVAGITAITFVAVVARGWDPVHRAERPVGHAARSQVEDSTSITAIADALEQSRFTPQRVLRGVDLRARNLNHLELWGIDLKGAQLDGANLAFVDLTASCLQDAVLRGVNLAGADLRRADLRGTNLADANLHGARLARSGYDRRTVWPRGYPHGSGARRVGPGARSRCDLPWNAEPGNWAGGS
ncbi:MAG: pentapeptide repeat-containing protein [Chloroflexota bacterium]|nr:pentapeptide repeat-containing protein [Chloroflexota bacterium]